VISQPGGKKISKLIKAFIQAAMVCS